MNITKGRTIMPIRKPSVTVGVEGFSFEEVISTDVSVVSEVDEAKNKKIFTFVYWKRHWSIYWFFLLSKKLCSSNSL